MDFDYQVAARSISDHDLQVIQNYYQDWEYHGQIDLKFRFIKLFYLDLKENEGRWAILNQLVNKRRIHNHMLGELLRDLISRNIIPIRVFHGVTEWLAPNEVFSSNYIPRLLNSGFLPLECDTSIDDSLENAKILAKILKNTRVVFSGNKSFHIWWLGFSVKNYLSKVQYAKLWQGSNREAYELKARKKAFAEIETQTPYKLDYRISVDTRRVVPIISSFNGFTKRKVIEIPYNDLISITVDQIINDSSIVSLPNRGE